MKLIDEQKISRGMLKVESGEDLVEALQTLANAAGWLDAMITGAGTLELVEILKPDGKTVTLDDAELLSLAGRIHRSPDGKRLVTLRASVLADGGVTSGRITAAMTGGLVLVIDAVSERGANRSVPPTIRKASATEPSPASVAPQAVAAPHAPARAASPMKAAPQPKPFIDGQRSASKPLSQSFKTKPVVRPIAAPHVDLDDDDDENPIVNVGDFVQHPQLGLCEVVGDDDSGGTKIRVPSGKTRVLRLEHLHVLAGVENDEGKMVFKVTGPRKRR